MDISSRRRWLALLCLLLPWSLPERAGAATVSPFAGTPIDGPSLTFAGNGTALTIGSTTMPLSDCDSLCVSTPATEAAVTIGHARIGVWLIDGSWLPAEKVGADATHPDTILVNSPLGDWSLPLASVLGWGTELSGLPADGDGIVVASGPLQGRVVGISDGNLQVQTPLSPQQPLSLAVTDVISLHLATPLHVSHGVILAATLDPSRPPLYVLPQPGLPLAAAPTVATGDALTHLRLRVEGGRRVYLSALTPTKVSEEGAFDVVWHWKADSDLDGGPLRLGGVTWAHGLSVHSKAALAWAIGGGYSRLHALAGIADLVAPEGDCAAELLGDGHSLWSRSSVKGADKPITLDLDLSGVKLLELHVDFGARYDIGDHFTLADAWLLAVHPAHP